MTEGIGENDWRLVELDEFYRRYKDVERKVREIPGILDTFGRDKKFSSLNTMVVGNSTDGFARKLLYSCLGNERYDVERIVAWLGYESEAGITHSGIDTEAVLGTKPGECSVVIGTERLVDLHGIYFSEEARKMFRKNNAVIIYPTGNQQFLVMKGQVWEQRYRSFLETQGVKTNLVQEK